MASRPIVGASRLYLPKFEGPLDQYRKVVQLKTLLGRQQFNQVQLQRAQSAQQAEQQAAALERQVDDLIANASGDIRATLPKIRALSPEHWKQWKGWFADYDKKDAEAKMAVIDLGTKRSEQMAQLTQGVYDQASRDAAIRKGVEEQLIDEETAQRWLSMPYDPAKIKALQKSTLTTQQFLTHERNKLNTERQQQQDARNAPEKVYEFIARTMGTARSQKEWTFRRGFAQRGLKRMGVSEDYLGLIPEQYSPQVAQQMKELGISPTAEKTAKPSARDLSGREATLVEGEAVRALQAAGDDADRAIEIVNQSANIPARLKAKIRQRIRERLRPGAGAPSEIEELRDLLLTDGGATGRTTTRQESAEGRTAINPETGEKVVYRGGKWVPVPK